MAYVFRQRCAKCIAGLGVPGRPGDARDIGRGGRGVPKGARGLTRRLDRGPTSNEVGDDHLEEGLRMRMLMVEKFDLDLSKAGDDMVLGVEDHDAVVDEFEGRCSIAGMQNLRGPIGAYCDRGDQPLPADER